MSVYENTETAPPTVKAADGKTVLYRFDVEAVIYAKSKAEAEQKLEAANIYLDRARIVPRVVTAETDFGEGY